MFVNTQSDFVANSYGESWDSSSEKKHESQLKKNESEIENAWAFM